MGTRTRKWLLRLGISFTLLLLAVGGGMFYLYKNQEKLINPIVNQINRQLAVEVSVKDIKLSFRQFPFVSVAFENVKVAESTPKPDTLFAVEYLYLVFRPWDLLQDDINIHSIELRNGVVNIKVFADGSVNYKIWQDREDEEMMGSIALKSVNLENIEFYFHDFEKEIIAKEYVKNIELRGDFDASEVNIKGKGVLVHRNLIMSDFVYDAPIEVNTDFDLVQLDDNFRLTANKMAINGMPVSFSLFMQPQSTNVRLSGEKIDATQIPSLMPSSYKDAFNWFKLQGKLNIDFDLEAPEIGAAIRNVNFKLQDGKFSINDRPLVVEKLSTQGNLRFGRNSNDLRGLLTIDQFSGRIDGDLFELNGYLQDFQRPKLSIEYHAEISLKNIILLANAEGFENISGSTTLKGTFENQFRSLDKIEKRDFAAAKAKADFTLSNGVLSYSDVHYQNINADLSVLGNDLRLQNLSLHTGTSDLHFTGNANNLLPFLIVPGEKLELNAKLTSKSLTIDQWLTSENSSTESLYTLEFPEYISAKLNTQIQEFRFGTFRATNLSGLAHIDSKGMLVRFDRIQALQGTITNAEMLIDARKKPYELSLKAQGKDIDMQTMFEAFGNFGQDVLTARELQGSMKASINLRSKLLPSLQLPLESITAEADIQIDRGRLLNFAPMQALSRFAKIDELNDVRFERLKNTLHIHNALITIPNMDIRSNIIELELEGTHSFNNQIDYLVKMNLREALFAERKRRRSDFDDLMIESNDGQPRIWVRMKGDISDPEISLDKRQIRQTLGEQLREQGRQLRGEQSKREQKQQQYEFEWDPD